MAVVVYCFTPKTQLFRPPFFQITTDSNKIWHARMLFLMLIGARATQTKQKCVFLSVYAPCHRLKSQQIFMTSVLKDVNRCDDGARRKSFQKFLMWAEPD